MCGETVIWLKPKAQGRVQSIGSWLDRFGEDGRKGDNTCRHQYEFLLARNMNWRGRSNRAHNSLLASPPRERWLRHFGWRPDPSSKNLRFFFFYFWSKHSYFDVTERASLACTDSFLQGSECVCVCVCVSVIYSKISFPFMLATGNKKLILKIGDDRESSFGSKIDVYFNLREGQVYPLGLYGGTEVELTWLCLRKTQKTGRLYCTSTLLTCIRLVKLGRQFGYISRLFHFPYNIIIYIIASGNKVLGNKTIIVTLFFFFFFFGLRCVLWCGRWCRQPKKPRIEMMKDACIGRRYISQLEAIRPKDVFSSLVTVRYIHKLSISCVCSGCGSTITRGACTYVGCHWKQPGCKVDLKAWYV